MDSEFPLLVLNSLRKNRADSDPELKRRAIVECDDYQCVGIQLPDGNWIDLQGTLLKVVSVIAQL